MPVMLSEDQKRGKKIVAKYQTAQAAIAVYTGAPRQPSQCKAYAESICEPKLGQDESG